MQAIDQRYSKYINNTLWIFFGKFFGLGLGFVSTALVARYLGPQDYGRLTYALSAIGIVAVVGHLGLSGIVVRDLVKYPDECNTILGTVAFLKIISLACGYIFIVVFFGVLQGFRSIEFCLVAIAGSSLLLRSLESIEFWFQSCVQSKYISSVDIISKLSSAVIKVLLSISGFSVIYFSLAPALSSLVSACLLILLYNRTSGTRIYQWKVSFSKARGFISQSWLVYLGSFFAVIYLKVDQIMLRWLADISEVGQYAVASQISEAFYFIPTAIVVSFYPKLIELHKNNASLFNSRLQRLFDLLTILSLVVVAVVTLSFQYFQPLIFGKAYSASIPILYIHMWAGVFIFQRALFSKWILIQNLLKFSLITQGAGALINVALNFLLIPAFGGIGAAYATLFSYATASFLCLFFYKKTRPVFLQMTLALLAPIRYPYKFYNWFIRER